MFHILLGIRETVCDMETNSKTSESIIAKNHPEFHNLLLPSKEEDIKKRQREKTPNLYSGYTIGETELMLPSGALSIFASPTSHGKTTFLINLALNIAKRYPEKQVYFFSYEEDSDAILMKTLNIYMGIDISNNNRKHIRNYFTADKGQVDKALELLTNKMQEIILKAKDSELNNLSIPVKQLGSSMKEMEKNFFTQAKDKFFKDLITSGRLNIHYVNYNLDTLTDAIRHIHKNANPGAVFIDDIQLISLPDAKNHISRQQEMKMICHSLKNISVETGLPIILSAPFNKEVTNQLRLHSNKLIESLDLERVANLVVGFWNNFFMPVGLEEESNGSTNRKNFGYKETIYVKILKGRDIKQWKDDILHYNSNTGVIKN